MAILLPQPLSCWDYRHVPSCWAEGSRNTCQIRPCLTHPMTHTVGPQQHHLSPWEPSTEKWDGVFGAGRKAALGGCLASSPQAARPHPTPEFALTSWIYLLAWSQAAPCLSRLPLLQPASLCPIPKPSGRRWEHSSQKWLTAQNQTAQQL